MIWRPTLLKLFEKYYFYMFLNIIFLLHQKKKHFFLMHQSQKNHAKWMEKRCGKDFPLFYYYFFFFFLFLGVGLEVKTQDLSQLFSSFNYLTEQKFIIL